jgi:hypothetical protein
MDRQYVGIDFHRRRSVVVRMSATARSSRVFGWRTIRWRSRRPWRRQARIPKCRGGHLRLVLGGGSAAGQRRPGAPANPQGLNWGQWRVKNDERRHRFGRHVAPGSAARGVDRPAGGAGAAGVGALPGQARGVAFGTQGPGACGAPSAAADILEPGAVRTRSNRQ